MISVPFISCIVISQVYLVLSHVTSETFLCAIFVMADLYPNVHRRPSPSRARYVIVFFIINYYLMLDDVME